MKKFRQIALMIGLVAVLLPAMIVFAGCDDGKGKNKNKGGDDNQQPTPPEPRFQFEIQLFGIHDYTGYTVNISDEMVTANATGVAGSVTEVKNSADGVLGNFYDNAKKKVGSSIQDLFPTGSTKAGFLTAIKSAIIDTDEGVAIIKEENVTLVNNQFIVSKDESEEPLEFSLTIESATVTVYYRVRYFIG